MIRRATPDDTGRLIEMGQRFVAETEYAGMIVVRPERLAATIAGVLAHPDGVILVSDTEGGVSGMIAMLVYDHPYSGERMAFEVVWWVDPEARGGGVRLLKAAEQWARERGSIAMQMVAPNEQVGALYRRLGYSPVETSFQRSL